MKKSDNSNDKWYWATLSFNWADEMDIVCHQVMKESEKKEFIKDCKQLGDGQICIGIGTNEEVWFTGNELVDSVKFTKIPSPETLKFLRSKCQVTDPTSIDSIWERVCDENEANEDYDGEDLDDEGD